MGGFILFEASEPRGTTYRLGFGWFIHPKPVSMVAAITRLF